LPRRHLTATIPARRRWHAHVTVTARIGGNTATDTGLDRDRGTPVAITGVEGGDNTINAAEAADGIVITGTAEGVRRSRERRHGDRCANGTYTADHPAPAQDCIWRDGDLRPTRWHNGHDTRTLTLTAGATGDQAVWKAATARSTR
jgi:hypothetical protein